MRDADVNQCGVKIGGIQTSNFPYADDTALLETSVEGIEWLTTAIHDVTIMNVCKTRSNKQQLYNI